MVKRLFLAIDIPKEWQKELKKVQLELHKQDPRLRLTPARNFHLTVCFIGDTQESEFKELGQQIEIVVENFIGDIIIQPEKFGAFYHKGRSVFWFGVKTSNLELLAKHLKKFAQAKYQNQTFKGHITLARLNRRTKQNEFNLAINLSDYKAKELILYESTLNNDGPIYTRLKSWKLN